MSSSPPTTSVQIFTILSKCWIPVGPHTIWDHLLLNNLPRRPQTSEATQRSLAISGTHNAYFFVICYFFYLRNHFQIVHTYLKSLLIFSVCSQGLSPSGHVLITVFLSASVCWWISVQRFIPLMQRGGGVGWGVAEDESTPNLTTIRTKTRLYDEAYLALGWVGGLACIQEAGPAERVGQSLSKCVY